MGMWHIKSTESKGQTFNFNCKVNFKDFYTKLCVCSHNWKLQNISDRILYSVIGARGTQGVIFLKKYGHEAYPIDWNDEQNRIPVNFSA